MVEFGSQLEFVRCGRCGEGSITAFSLLLELSIKRKTVPDV
jgi:hypothetical protein